MNDEVLVRVEGVGKKFCRDLKKSLRHIYTPGTPMQQTMGHAT
ncbi:hypothetical protein [Magnetovirga frankeli]